MAGKAEFGEVDEIVGTLIDGLGPSLRSRPMPSVKPALFDEEDMQTIGQFRVASPLLQQKYTFAHRFSFSRLLGAFVRLRKVNDFAN